MVVVDTSVWVDFIRGTDSPEAATLASLVITGQEVALTDLVFTELLQGVKSDSAADRLAADLEGFTLLRIGDTAGLRLAASLYRATRAAGSTVRKTIDCLIAATCIHAGGELLHKDADFDRLAAVSDLQIFAFAG